MSEKQQTGLYNKFRVERTDGKSAPDEKHDGCEYFVLDLTHDVHAYRALKGYIESCKADYPALADDLTTKLIDMSRRGLGPNPIPSTTPPPPAPLEEAALRTLAKAAIQSVAELPDRTSPDEWPEAMLVTADELRAVLDVFGRQVADLVAHQQAEQDAPYMQHKAECSHWLLRANPTAKSELKNIGATIDDCTCGLAAIRAAAAHERISNADEA